MEKPLVSVNICTYNRSNLIEKAIDSVLQQDYPHMEIIVADSGSDDTEILISEISARTSKDNPDIEIKYFKNDTEGISQNRNFALVKSEGKYIAVLDSDDYWISPQKISRQVQFLEEHPDHALVGTGAIVVDSDDEKIGQIENNIDDKDIRQNFLLKNQFVHSSVLFRKDAFDEYNENIFIWEDYEVFLEIARRHKVANLPESMTVYKKHSTNVSNKNKVRGIETLGAILQSNKNYYPKYYQAVIKNYMRWLRSFLPF